MSQARAGRRARCAWTLAVLWLAAGAGTTLAAEPEDAGSEPSPEVGDAATSDAGEPTDAAVAPALGADLEPLKVAVAGSAPFVLRDEGGELEGMALDMWEALGEDEPRLAQSELIPYDSVDEALDAVRRGEADAALGPISITAKRVRRLSFTQPYYLSALSILAPATVSLWTRLAPFATWAFAAGILFLFFVLAGVGTLLWLSERKANPEQFPPRPVAGIGNGIWLALVTMTTVGYGDLSPVTRRGKVVAGVWMLLAMLTASSLTASIATALTLSQLESPGISSASDLKGKAIAVVPSSPAEGFVREAGGRILAVQNVEEGIRAVEDGTAKAMVWDRPVLAYHLKTHPESELSLSPTSYRPRGYGIAAPHEAVPLLRLLDLGILRLLDDGELNAIRARWLSD